MARDRRKTRANSKAWRERHKAKAAVKQRKYLLKLRYGITPEEREEMGRRQDGRCAICGEHPRRLVIDHDHVTKKVRELLCDGCNTGLGAFKDDPGLLYSARVYLAKHLQKHS